MDYWDGPGRNVKCSDEEDKESDPCLNQKKLTLRIRHKSPGVLIAVFQCYVLEHTLIFKNEL